MNCPTVKLPKELVITSIVSIAVVLFPVHSMWTWTGNPGADSSIWVLGFSQSTWPLKIAGLVASSQIVLGASIVMKVGALSSASNTQSLS